MIPRGDVSIEWDVDYGTLYEPSVDNIECGGFGTREYAGALVMEADWSQARDWLVREREALTRIASSAEDDVEFDELAAEE
jgi:hypothetical protein